MTPIQAPPTGMPPRMPVPAWALEPRPRPLLFRSQPQPWPQPPPQPWPQTRPRAPYFVPPTVAPSAPGHRDGGIPSPRSGVLDAGPFQLHAYGAALALGGIAGTIVAHTQLRASSAATAGLGKVVLPAVVAGVVGARAYHVVTDWQLYQDRPVDALKIWNGGLGIYGGVAAGLGVAALLAHRSQLPIAPLLDAAAVALPVSQAIGRFGNYFNQELFGRPTDLPWGLQIDPENRPEGTERVNSFHPTFAYEAAGNLALAGGLFALSKAWKGRPAGILLPLYALGYGAIRFGVEGLRIDPAKEAGGLRTNQWMSLAVAGTGALGAVALLAKA